MISGKYGLSLSYTNTIHASQHDAIAAHVFEVSYRNLVHTERMFPKCLTVHVVVIFRCARDPCTRSLCVCVYVQAIQVAAPRHLNQQDCKYLLHYGAYKFR